MDWTIHQSQGISLAPMAWKGATRSHDCNCDGNAFRTIAPFYFLHRLSQQYTLQLCLGHTLASLAEWLPRFHESQQTHRCVHFAPWVGTLHRVSMCWAIFRTIPSMFLPGEMGSDVSGAPVAAYQPPIVMLSRQEHRRVQESTNIFTDLHCNLHLVRETLLWRTTMTFEMVTKKIPACRG